MSKKKFTVLHAFTDLQDKDKVYNVGDSFPKPANKKVSDKRIEELSTDKNKQGKALIQEVE
ncbi:hypothetical protein BUY98_08825 [Staphylococcus gallinarum]|uniref:hypothetical protein n=1 Tax=Staphylococcus gallinarum TaxID=1293 RepID=UPI000D1D0012|nr:hypothetical protein [Staphylococcus gallinarum]PTE79303.1 hypothetical protein BUY96_02465 [Staphylococcus gallinarum]PTL18505.1 hypothetical protein BUZ08_00930 [Staphylococcus gallinarum]RIL33024.1 hypothetical protein BUY98_08825 [Staphylococcus gallinarum]RIO80038.1 hypothetical protein BUZ07_03880 [Staphylococcus gallinarum]RIO87699.1 hypothetical protein BUZ06_09870 [Staphylococcus gallinarum]